MPTCHSSEGEMRQLNVECINTRRLKEAQDDNQKISVMRYVAGAMTYKVNKMPDTNFYFNLWLISQLDLLRGTEIQGEFINLWSHGGLCAPTIETLLFTLKCDQGFSKRYGRGRKVFQTVFWLMILKVFLMTTYFRMETLWPHYNDDFMVFYWWTNFLSWNELNKYIWI